jgi:mono/diheme cytochrome c family protein
LIDTARERAIAVRADDVTVPTLGAPDQVKAGAGNYAAMCTGCHLAPGMPPTELSQGLYPAAPALATVGAPDPARTFWIIKHGIKASGMPAWGKSMDDQYIWGMVAFLQQLPTRSPAEYQALVASSGGHAHGGGESMPHDDAMPGMDHHGNAEHAEAEGSPHEHGDAAPAHDDSGSAPHKHVAPATPAPTTHMHADGKTHVDNAPTPATPPAEAPGAEHDDDHQH